MTRHYEFKDFGAYAALLCILDFEAIPFEKGIGPNGLTISVDDKRVDDVETAIREWAQAMYVIHNNVIVKK